MIPCNWHLVICGVNHRTASVEHREPLQIGRDELASANSVFCNLHGVRESAILSTCNRIEFYFVADKTDNPCDLVRAFYSRFRNRDIAAMENCLYTRKNRHAADHLFRVAAGIESMVLGENQIQGQLKDAYSSACNVKAAGKVIHRLFHQAFRVGKKVRSDTELGKGACSVSSATVEMLHTRMKLLQNPTILFIGINQMIALAAAGLNRLGYTNLKFANRTESKAVDFAGQYDCNGYSLTHLPGLLNEADVVITCTSSPQPIIDDAMIADRVAACPDKKLLIADMAIPRDVDISGEHRGVELCDLEAVKAHVATRQDRREKEIPLAEKLIEDKLEQFIYWFDHVRHEPIYNGVGDLAEQIRLEELRRVLDTLDPDTRDRVDRATRRMVDKIMKVKMRTSPETSKTE